VQDSRPSGFASDLPRYAMVLVWAVVCAVVVFWRLGEASFWDPDEAHYAQASREMLMAGRWLLPSYNGQPFFDKPILFYLLQVTSFSLFGVTEFAARLVPALASLGLLWFTARAGQAFYDRPTGQLSALMLGVSAPFFALIRYAIVDMVFACFLIGGLVLIVEAALVDRPKLQYPGYALLALAVLTKGPLALVLTGLGWALSAACSAEFRRRTLSLRWGVGLAIIVAISAPWYILMWHQHGDAFLETYLYKENLKLFASTLYPTQRSRFQYLQLLVLGLLPWTPVLLGRIVDLVRTLWKRQAVTAIETALWGWIVAVIGFFSLSSFRLDHYIFTVLPLACVLMASGWQHADDVGRSDLTATKFGVKVVGPILVVLGIGVVVYARMSPLGLDWRINAAPVALVLCGIGLTLAAWRRQTGLRQALFVAAAMVATYAVVLTVVGPVLELEKVVKPMASALAPKLEVSDRVGAYKLDRWKTSWRFYVGHNTEQMDRPEEADAFFAKPGRFYCMMSSESLDQLRERGLRLRVVAEAEGLNMTSGRTHTQRGVKLRRRFVIVTNE
jgi:4-amino-4-deoxy-L-arabinose transferase-like glycosyltransferase